MNRGRGMLRDRIVFGPRLVGSSHGSWYTICHRPINKTVVGSPSTCAGITFHYSTINSLGKMVKGYVLCFHAVKAYKGSKGAAVLILNLSTRWR